MTGKAEVVVQLKVNGQSRKVLTEPRRLLSDVLREDCALTGTHVGCEHGVCGACTVLLGGVPVRSCLVYAVQAEGQDITTIEGFSTGDRLSPVQRQRLPEMPSRIASSLASGYLRSRSSPVIRMPGVQKPHSSP